MNLRDRLKAIISAAPTSQNSENISKSELSKTAETIEKGVSAVKSSFELEIFSEILAGTSGRDQILEERLAIMTADGGLSEAEALAAIDVFEDTEAGAEAIGRLAGLIDGHAANGTPFLYLNNPTTAAWEAECGLVRAIAAGGREDVEQALADLIATHRNETSGPGEWTPPDVPLYTLILTRDGERADSHTCNLIQARIIAAIWRRGPPGAGVEIVPLD